MKKEEKNELKELFLVKRGIEKKSFDTISKEINVSKQTLINWNEEMKDKLSLIEGEEKEKSIEKFRQILDKRLEGIFALYEKVENEISVRSLEDIPYKVLFDIKIQLEGIINKNTSFIYQTGESRIDLEDIGRQVNIKVNNTLYID
mgnify:FL=1